MSSAFRAALEKRAENYYSKHLSEPERLAIFEEAKRETAARALRSGGYLRGGLIGAGVGGLAGALMHRPMPLRASILGGLVGAGVGALGDVMANANTNDARALMRMTPEQRRRAYRSRFATMRDMEDEEDRDLRRMEVDARMRRAAMGDRPVIIVHGGRA